MYPLNTEKQSNSFGRASWVRRWDARCRSTVAAAATASSPLRLCRHRCS